MFVGLVAHSRRAALRLGLAAALAACGEVTQAPLPLDVTIAPSAVPALEIGDAVQLTAAVTGGRGSNVRSVVWTSSDPAVATISGAGAVTAVAPGQATITASAVADRGRTAQIGITVNAPRVTAITVTMPITTLNIGQAAAILAQVTATGIGSNRRVRFTSSAPQVATVRTDDGLTGVVTAVGGGEARIIAAAEIDPSRTAEVIVRVTGTRAAAIELTPTADSVLLGGTTMFAAIVRDSLGGAVSGATVQWVSTNPSIATVSASGEVRGVAIGEARVVASTPVEPGSPAVITAEAIVRVRSGLRVQVVPREATQLLTDQLTLGVSVFGESQTIDRTVDFVSRTPTVATVNASGV
ncbi:MAG: Ig-like domain-containing protein, partial [Gemmatimonadaceae bacterium]|nr:Ig-like domain-containing protein [Gemmatimonadaceae bacterium]